MAKNEEKKMEYLKEILDEQSSDSKTQTPPKQSSNAVLPLSSPQSNMEYTFIDINVLPAGRYYSKGTKIGIRAAKVSEIQAYSMVDDNNFVDMVDKMNELLSRNIIYYAPNGTRGSYKNVKEADRVFLVFMIRELTFQGGTTLTKDVVCDGCGHEFKIPFRATSNSNVGSTFEISSYSDDYEDYYNPVYGFYELIDGERQWTIAPTTIGIQEAFYEEVRRSITNKTPQPDAAFMKIMPYILHDRDNITEDGLKAKYKEFKSEIGYDLFQAMDEIVSNLKVGITGLTMKCPACEMEAHTPFDFPNSKPSSIFKSDKVLDRFKRRK